MRHYDKVLEGLKRCNKPAKWQARNGYRVCGECYYLESDKVEFGLLSEDGPGPWGPCDRTRDGLGAMSWHKRLNHAR